MSGDDAVARVAAMFESMTRADVRRLPEFYVADARFADPFNDVRGIAAIERVFLHMFDALHEPRFAVRDRLVDGERALLVWDFGFAWRANAARHAIPGTSLLRFDGDGRIAEHVDYWDASELFATLPALGAAVRWLKRRARG